MEIIVQQANKKIGNKQVLCAVNLHLNGGKVYGLRGPNGSGKTMVMRLIAGLIQPTSGAVYINKAKIGRDIDFPDSLGMLIENPGFLPNYTGFRNLALLASIKGLIDEDQIRRTMRDVGLDPDDKRRYRKYSLGMKQRLGIAAAIMERPEIILLDEPTNALDENGVNQVIQLICREKERGALIVVSCHDAIILDAIADEIYFGNEGKFQKV